MPDFWEKEAWTPLLEKYGSYRRVQLAYLKGELTPQEERTTEHFVRMTESLLALAILIRDGSE